MRIRNVRLTKVSNELPSPVFWVCRCGVTMICLQVVWSGGEKFVLDSLCVASAHQTTADEQSGLGFDCPSWAQGYIEAQTYEQIPVKYLYLC